MTRWQKIRGVCAGIIMLVMGTLLTGVGGEMYGVILLVYSCGLVLFGIRMLFYYFTMARYMTGGILFLYLGIFFTDLGVFAFSLSSVPRVYIMMYLAGSMALAGVIDVLRGLDGKRIGGRWKLRTLRGIISVLSAVICLFYTNTPDMAVMIYSAGLVNNGVIRIVNCFVPSEIITIQ